MVQTNSAASLLNGTALDQAPSKAGKQTDDSGAFSQEFENQVKKSGQASSGADRGGHAAKPANGADKEAEASSGKPVKGEKAAEEDTKDTSDTSAATAEAANPEDEAVKSGKDLPPQAAADIDAAHGKQETEHADEAEIGGEAVSPAALNDEHAAVISALLQGRKTAGEEHAASSMLPAEKTASSDVSETTLSDDDGEFSALRLRDVVAQRMLAGGGNGQGDAASSGRQGKMEMNALLSMQNGQGRGPGSFDEALKFSSVTGMPQAPANQTAAASVPVTMTLAVPVQQQGWDQAMGERVVWMARSNLQHAEIQLNPRELGPIEIKISMQKDQTHVNFVAHHATTRDAIESALPRLREMLSEQGLNLGQADVSQHSFGDNGKQAASANGSGVLASSSGADEEIADESLVTQHVSYVAPGGVDYFA